MWTGSISHNDLTGLGAPKDFAPHQLGHELSAKFDCAHGASLSAMWGSWAAYCWKENPSRFCPAGREGVGAGAQRRQHPGPGPAGDHADGGLLPCAGYAHLPQRAGLPHQTGEGAPGGAPGGGPPPPPHPFLPGAGFGGWPCRLPRPPPQYPPPPSFLPRQTNANGARRAPICPPPPTRPQRRPLGPPSAPVSRTSWAWPSGSLPRSTPSPAGWSRTPWRSGPASLRCSPRCWPRPGLPPTEVAAIGITNQRETTIVWDKGHRPPIYNAIVWQCRRTASLCEELKAEGPMGLHPGAHRPAHRRLLLRHQAQVDSGPCGGARERARPGELLFGTVDTWLVWKLTGGKVHVTDYTNASRTMLFDIQKLCWDDICRPGHPHGHAAPGAGLQPGVRICQPAGGEGAHCRHRRGPAGRPLRPGLLPPQKPKTPTAPAAFLLMNTGDQLCRSQNGLLTTIAMGWNGKVQYALEGSVFVGGAVIQWVRDELRFISGARDAEYYASKVPDTGGRLSGARLHRLGCALLGHVRPGRIGGTDPGDQPGSHHPGGSGVHRLPELGPGGCHGEGHRDSLSALNADGGASRDKF